VLENLLDNDRAQPPPKVANKKQTKLESYFIISPMRSIEKTKNPKRQNYDPDNDQRLEASTPGGGAAATTSSGRIHERVCIDFPIATATNTCSLFIGTAIAHWFAHCHRNRTLIQSKHPHISKHVYIDCSIAAAIVPKSSSLAFTLLYNINNSILTDDVI